MIKHALDDEGILFTIISFFHYREISNLLFISKQHTALLTSPGAFKLRLDILHARHGIYSPPRCPPKRTWKEIFTEINKNHQYFWIKRNRVDRRNEISYYPTDKVRVGVRVKPELSTNCDDDETVVATDISSYVTLPLHQRLEIIRISRNLDSNEQALRILKNQGDWFGKKWSDNIKGVGANYDDSPLDQEEKKQCNEIPSLKRGVHTVDDVNDRVIMIDPTKGLREFRFDDVMKETCAQEDVYDTCAMERVCDFINGRDAVILAYGQTGSGKTYTMHGNQSTTPLSTVLPSRSGIIPRACAEVVSATLHRQNNLTTPISSTISVTYVEIYGNEITDLLSPDNALVSRSTAASQRYVLEGAAEQRITGGLTHIMRLLNEGNERRRVASTAMNERSSRAHSLFVLTLRQETVLDDGPTKKVTSRLFLADLGGSEQQKKSLPYYHKKRHNVKRTKEAVNINLGLLALKKCAVALNSKKKRHVPYADSKLTMLLSRGWDDVYAKMSIIVCASKSPHHTLETMDAFNFGISCSRIRGRRGVISGSTTTAVICEIIRDLDERIEKCEAKVKELERWEVREEIGVDDFGEEYVRKTTVLVGAESYRRELGELLRRKAELEGTKMEDSERRGHMDVYGFGDACDYGMGRKFISNESGL